MTKIIVMPQKPHGSSVFCNNKILLSKLYLRFSHEFLFLYHLFDALKNFNKIFYLPEPLGLLISVLDIFIKLAPKAWKPQSVASGTCLFGRKKMGRETSNRITDVNGSVKSIARLKQSITHSH